jgi:hypothetical protein
MRPLCWVKSVSDCSRRINKFTFAFSVAFWSHFGRILRRGGSAKDARRKGSEEAVVRLRRVPNDRDVTRCLARSHVVAQIASLSRLPLKSYH